MMKHILKTDPAVFQAVADGAKTYEIRLNDRGFAVGDELLLRETTHTGAEIALGAALEYTGREITKHIGHVLGGYGLQDGWVILSFAERTTAPVSLTDEKIIQRFESHINTGPDCFDLQDGDSAYWVKQSEMVKFARALMAAAPAPIQQEPVAFIVRLKDNPHKVLCWPDMGPRKRQSANLEYTPLYATPPALAGSQVQAAGDALDAARYRWLREKRDIPHGSRNIPWVVALDPEEKIHTMILRAGIDLDHAIDAAMREQP